MKHLLIDALSVNNLSGRHVLLGHVGQLVAGLSEGWQVTVLVGRANAGLLADLPDDVRHVVAPIGAGWLGRAIWMQRNAASICRELQVDLVFSPSGMLSGGQGGPQVVLAQNPWPLVPGMARGIGLAKAALQCRQFARAYRSAELMVFNSRYMQELYEQTFGARHGQSIVAHQGLSEPLIAAGASAAQLSQRRPLVLCVSVMARHKAIEVLVESFCLAAVSGAELILVGDWPDAGYRREIEYLITERGQQSAITIRGHVDAASLHDLYGRARVFCLLSRCESFGIPAVEAQAFGTPVVVAEGTAAPEITAGGGIAVPRDDAEAAARALRSLLTDDEVWNQFSERARANAERFNWPECSAPLVAAIDKLDLGRG